MTDNSRKNVLLTGASGALGRMLAPRLAAASYALRLSDIVPFPDPLPKDASFVRADLSDAQAVAGIMDGIGCVLHFGGVSVEKPFEEILPANIVGITNLFEAAHRQKARVVFASSNHTIGFYERGTMLDVDMPYRPDGYYGLSKAYGELLGRMFFDKHGVESVHIRIGSCLPEPVEARHLSTWLSHDDLFRFACAAIDAPETGHAVVWGASANTRSWWETDDRERIGYTPQDNAEDFAEKIASIRTDDAITERYQGGVFCSQVFSRDTP